ncbi:hypothetical protein [Paenibacillus borealis]|uniref:hypothetical protein n=1 Tax=Paenibacillus borealis TaxID=160799 RepID=UPI00117DD799|nr:hypothetical protein [Paenibacillus borealis]
MRYSSMFVVLIIILVFITACGTEKGNISRTASPATNIASSSSVIPDKSNSELIEKFMGKWRIDRIYAYGVGGSKNDEQKF